LSKGNCKPTRQAAGADLADGDVVMNCQPHIKAVAYSDKVLPSGLKPVLQITRWKSPLNICNSSR